MSKPKFKRGDKVKFVIPEGRRLVTGSANKTGFKGGIISKMIDTIKKKDVFTVYEAFSDGTVFLMENSWVWDADWFQPLEEVKKELITVDFIISDNETKAVNLHRVGVTTKNPEDKHDESIAMMISMARMLNISEDKVSAIIDVLYGDMHKPLKEISSKELCEELWKRI